MRSVATAERAKGSCNQDPSGCSTGAAQLLNQIALCTGNLMPRAVKCEELFPGGEKVVPLFGRAEGPLRAIYNKSNLTTEMISRAAFAIANLDRY